MVFSYTQDAAGIVVWSLGQSRLVGCADPMRLHTPAADLSERQETIHAHIVLPRICLGEQAPERVSTPVQIDVVRERAQLPDGTIIALKIRQVNFPRFGSPDEPPSIAVFPDLVAPSLTQASTLTASNAFVFAFAACWMPFSERRISGVRSANARSRTTVINDWSRLHVTYRRYSLAQSQNPLSYRDCNRIVTRL
jgi:hypothetical protein